MLRPILFVVFLSSGAFAQQDMKSRLHPITGEVRHAGVYHVARGTWTRGAALGNLLGPDTIYNNTCSTGYFIDNCCRISHRSAVPSPSHPHVASAFHPGRYDEAPGCTTSYLVDGFQIGYCSSSTSPVGFDMGFASSYSGCGFTPIVPDATIFVQGLPGGSATGAQRCWTVDVDLAVGSQGFVLLADGDGAYAGPRTSEQFGVSWKSNPCAGFTTGPIVAGNYTWTGGPVVGPVVPCSGTDGTIWDAPVNLSETGTGMCSNDYFRIDPGPGTPCCFDCGGFSGGGCGFFGGIIHADFHLKLYADAACPPSPMASLCHPGEGGVIACPCGNPPASSGRGCENSASTGGAVLSALGVASLGADSLVFHTVDERSAPLSILAQGTADIPGGAAYGQGVRCVGGTIKRLYVEAAAAGSIAVPQGGDPSVSARSAALGDPIPAGATRYYFVYYRDPIVLGGCPASSTFNATQGGSIVWLP